MEIAANSLATSSISLPTWSSSSLIRERICFASFKTISDIHVTGSFSTSPSRLRFFIQEFFGFPGVGGGGWRLHDQAVSNAVGNQHNQRSSLESLFCYDKSVPEEVIEKPIGLSLSEKNISGNPRCPNCLTRGAVLCATCSGSGLYVDSILESQGIIVKVRCLGCGGSGNILCTGCGGRGHLGSDH